MTEQNERISRFVQENKRIMEKMKELDDMYWQYISILDAMYWENITEQECHFYITIEILYYDY